MRVRALQISTLADVLGSVAARSGHTKSAEQSGPEYVGGAPDDIEYTEVTESASPSDMVVS